MLISLIVLVLLYIVLISLMVLVLLYAHQSDGLYAHQPDGPCVTLYSAHQSDDSSFPFPSTHSYGPLFRHWTMRFEAKHAYFKGLAQSLGNFG